MIKIERISQKAAENPEKQSNRSMGAIRLQIKISSNHNILMFSLEIVGTSPSPGPGPGPIGTGTGTGTNSYGTGTGTGTSHHGTGTRHENVNRKSVDVFDIFVRVIEIIRTMI